MSINRWYRNAAATAIGAVMLAAASLTASGTAAAEDAVPKFETVGGLRGFFDPGDRVVITARITAAEAFSGTVAVISNPSDTTITQRVDVAGGTTKAVQLITPTRSDIFDSIEVQLLDRNDDVVATTRISLKIADTTELVGVLPAAATRAGDIPKNLNLATETGRAEIEELTIEQAALGTGSLDVYDTIAAASSDINSLPQPALASLLDWMNRGGRLLLDDDGDLPALPEPWRPGAGGYALAGRGEVRVVGGAISTGKWASIIEPSGFSLNETSNWFVNPSDSIDRTQRALADRAGVRLPSLTPILIVLLAYWLVVSVGLFIVLKLTRRLTLAWIAIPLVAAITGTGIAVAGKQWRQTGQPAATAFVDSYPGGATAQVSVLSFTRDGGVVTVGLPSGWQSDNEAGTAFGVGGSSINPEVRVAGERAELRARLEAGQVNTAVVTGPTNQAGLEIDATIDDDQVVGTVRNTSPYILYDVAVFSVGGAEQLGELAPGGEATFSLDADPLPIGFDPSGRAWNSSSDLVERSAWDMAGSTRVLFPSGLVRAAGWTTERPGDVQGGDIATLTAVSTSAPIQVSDGAGPLHEGAIRAVNVRTTFNPWGNGFGDDAVFRYLIPPNADTGGGLVVEVPAGQQRVEIWTGTAWVPVAARGRLVAVPAAGIRDGVVLVRTPFDEFFSDISPVLRGRTTSDPS